MIAVLDFPENSDGTDAEAIPAFVDRLRSYQGS